MISTQMPSSMISTYVPTQFTAIICNPRYYLSYLLVAQFNNMTSFYQCTAIIIQVLATLLQLKYQTADQTTTPFATNPKTMLVVVFGYSINYLASIVLLRVRLHSFGVAAHLCSVFSGYASVASLAALLLPDSVRVYTYSFFALMSAVEVLCCCKIVMEEEEGADSRVFGRRANRFWNSLSRVTENPNGRRSYRLPV